ncbi:hypothetical protein ACWDTT_00340 [Streptosporangium sandarakinum]
MIESFPQVTRIDTEITQIHEGRARSEHMGARSKRETMRTTERQKPSSESLLKITAGHVMTEICDM